MEIERIENGYIVFIRTGYAGEMEKRYVFNDPRKLAAFVKEHFLGIEQQEQAEELKEG